MRAALLIIVGVAVTAAADSPKEKKPPPFEELAREFDYDRNALLNIREEKKEQRDGATVAELSYDSPRGGRVPATLVLPAGKGPFPAILSAIG
jgi:cephalosporin-C deacetylase-like acetyl esterase